MIPFFLEPSKLKRVNPLVTYISLSFIFPFSGSPPSPLEIYVRVDRRGK